MHAFNLLQWNLIYHSWRKEITRESHRFTDWLAALQLLQRLSLSSSLHGCDACRYHKLSNPFAIARFFFSLASCEFTIYRCACVKRTWPKHWTSLQLSASCFYSFLKLTPGQLPTSPHQLIISASPGDVVLSLKEYYHDHVSQRAPPHKAAHSVLCWKHSFGMKCSFNISGLINSFIHSDHNVCVSKVRCKMCALTLASGLRTIWVGRQKHTEIKLCLQHVLSPWEAAKCCLLGLESIGKLQWPPICMFSWIFFLCRSQHCGFHCFPPMWSP